MSKKNIKDTGLTSGGCEVSCSPAATSWHGSGRERRPPAAAAAVACIAPSSALC